jgi:hypothetical protein
MSTIFNMGGAGLWFTSAWSASLAFSKKKSLGPSIQDLLNQGAAIANAFASISQDQATGIALLATKAAKKRVDAQIKAIKDQAEKDAAAGSKVNITA